MRRVRLIGYILFALSFSSCGISGQKYKTVTADEFEKKMHEGTVQLVDVRTPEEYGEGHLPEAVNINFNADDFVDMAAKLDKSKPILVYCLSGGRSAKAAALISKKGAEQVYNLDGGITAWIKAGKAIEGGGLTGLNMERYVSRLKSEKLAIVDFNASWCVPCKMLKPALDKVGDKYKGRVSILPIDVDKNPDLAHALHIDGIPLIIMYKEGKEVWRTVGLTDQNTIEKEIELNKE